ncbi:hypothetical protein L7F22_007973 [Adiantum nelumboides]|nr:hypothetical protein [Adiantum nelumboides]
MPDSASVFNTPEVSCLRFIITPKGISMDPAKVKDIVEWSTPKSISEVRGFLGITGWYRIFVKDYALIATPLTHLLKKSSQLIWQQEQEECFNQLKQYLTSPLVLKLPDFTQYFEVVTNARGLAIGGVLLQEGRPIAFTSRKLRIHELNYPTMTWNF